MNIERNAKEVVGLPIFLAELQRAIDERFLEIRRFEARLGKFLGG